MRYGLSFPASDTKGFTLLEVLISTVILAVILSAVYSVFFISQKAVTGIDESLHILRESRTALDVMRRETEALNFSPENEYQIFKVDDRDFFGRQASRLSFTAFSPLSPGLSSISYYAEEKDGLMTVYKKVRPASDRTQKQAAVEVVEGVESFLVEALLGDRWVRTWDSAEMKKTPDRIRITLVFRAGPKTVSLAETIVPRIGKPI